ncbi:MAG: dethiobiotin synthase [Chloroflexi bacterium]|nr:dethiobiotin synthase [Chloroflexota bacterium]MBT7081989.1 dethiobiotin synthase [Chloroflexota bacterium]MBT7289664.1 dethiobiotin synthase [Chloroflexota bacterium]
MSNGLFITGTDTDAGKTVVAAGILKLLREKGVDAVPVKPIQTGGIPSSDGLLASDLEFSLATAGINPNQDEKKLMAPYVYNPACSPHLAGRLAQAYPELSKINDCIQKLLQDHQAVVVEGAGGIMVPLNETKTMLDLMKTLEYPVVLVSRLGLGTINHTLLSVQALQNAGLNLIGVVFCRTQASQPGNEFIEEDNPKTIAQFGTVKVLGNIRYIPDLDASDDKVWQCFEQDLPGFENILEVMGE